MVATVGGAANYISIAKHLAVGLAGYLAGHFEHKFQSRMARQMKSGRGGEQDARLTDISDTPFGPFLGRLPAELQINRHT